MTPSRKKPESKTGRRRVAPVAPLRPKRHGEPRMHPITFCVKCEEAIPAQALACFRCGTKQPHGEKAVQVVFCDKCGHDYPARAMSCHHCGHINQRHPLVNGYRA
jgi:ribosomal protein L40E